MRNIILVFFLIFGSITGNAQNKSLEDKLINNWKKEIITAKDGSPYYDQETLNLDLDLNIISKDSLYIFNAKKLNKLKYLLTPDSVIVVSGIQLKVREITDIGLVLESFERQGFDYRITYIPKKLFDLTYTPEAYQAKNDDVVFISLPGKLEPQFINDDLGPMDYIYEKFRFPSRKKGGFVVRFVVTKTGDLAGVRVVASSNDKYNAKLISAVLKTQGKWLPAVFKGEYVSTEVEYDYNLGYSKNLDPSTQVDSLEASKMYFEMGETETLAKNYRRAADHYKRATSYNPLNIEAYYKHIEASLNLKKVDDACESITYLLLLEQKKAIPLYEKYCK